MEQLVSDSSLHAARVLLSEQNVVGRTRWALPKRLVMRGSRLFTHRLVGAVQNVADAVQSVDSSQQRSNSQLSGELVELRAAGAAESERSREEVGRAFAEMDSRTTATNDRLTAELHSVAQQLRRATESIAALDAAVRGVQTRISVSEDSAVHLRSELLRTRALVNRLQRHSGTPAPGGEIATHASSDRPDDGSETQESPPSFDGLDDESYLEFEERFRGSREEIRARQRDALEYVKHFRPGEGMLLDLACGRGEWLEILGSEGIAAYGVDSNASMIKDAADAGLDVRCEDALAHLATREEGSLQGVSAFHFVEHVPLGVLIKMIDDSLLVLRPGGTLLLETPNPTNLMVGAASFYLDPTHVRPIHPEFLRFMVESRGFVDVEIHYVHPAVQPEVLLASGPRDGYLDARLGRVISAVETAIYGPQDYILVAHRAQVA